jgi:lipoprotein NlpI
VAHEINEIAAMSNLTKLLSLETDHSYLCQVGVWYWSIGHKRLALMAYQRSIELQPEAPTFFNLAVCHDDLENFDLAEQSMKYFYEMVPSDEDREEAEAMLRQYKKGHLVHS